MYILFRTFFFDEDSLFKHLIDFEKKSTFEMGNSKYH